MYYQVYFDGEMLDNICYQQYGSSAGYVEMVLAANPGLAELPEILPQGTEIYLPEIKKTPVKKTVNLWD